MTRLVAMMLLMAFSAGAWTAGPPDAQTRGRFTKVEEAEKMNLRGIALYQAGKLHEAKKVFADVLKIGEELYPKARFPRGHTELASSLNNLAFLHQAQGEYAKAEPLYRRALEMREGLYPRAGFPQGHPDLANSLNNLAFLHDSQGEYTKAEPLYRRALEMREGRYPKSRYPQGHLHLAESLNNLAALYKAQGDYAKAEPLYRRALTMLEGLYPRARYPQGHTQLASNLNNLAGLHQAQGDYAKAEPLYRRALEMFEGLYPKARFPHGHSNLGRSLNNLAFLHWSQGEYTKAESLFRRALDMYESLYPRARYPQGHAELATSLNNLAALHEAQGEYAKAEPLYDRALAMYERLYPRARFPSGHHHLASSLNNLAGLHESQGDYAKAEPLYRRALEMCEGLYPRANYPQGHPDLALSLNNLAFLHVAQEEYAKAEPLYRRALDMREGLYPRAHFPRGHPDLATSLNNLASLYKSQRDYARAEPLFRRALEMFNASAVSLAAYGSEAQALNYFAALPRTRDAFLSITRDLPKANAYRAVWQSKAILARVYEFRHLAALAATSREARLLWDSIVSLKRQRERLLLAPADLANARDRDRRLDEIDEELRKKQAQLLPLLPVLKRSDELAKASPVQLQKAQPADVAFIDLLRYVRFEQDPKVPGKKGEKRTPHYVAFVVTRSAVVRVELGESAPIEKTLDLWRRAITAASPSEPKHAAEAHRLLWAPLVKHLPARVAAVYVSPDAALNRLPWVALRDGKTGRILIEDHAVAVVMHGPMLLDRLTEVKQKPEAKPTLLAMGAVAYDSKPVAAELAMRGFAGTALKWGSLPGTEKELRQIVALARERAVVQRDGSLASAPTLLADLPKAETAHLATHGFFADARFRTVMQLDEKLFDRSGSERVGAGARSPMVLSGIVCAGANLPGTPNRGVLTAEAIVGLDLRRMNLAVLSACETGLGEVAGGEAVYGLARAFHVAGTRNVVASLWKVDDEATAALMVLFYRQLWGKEKVTPVEALRRAQLAVYREPGQIKEWAAGRGSLARLNPEEAIKPAKEKASPARAWAAFVLSGPGD